MIRRATAGEAADLTRLVLASKRVWGYPEEWMELWRNELAITPELVAGSETRVAERDGRLIGVLVLVVSGDSAELEHLWVIPEEIGTGVGRSLFSRAVALARDRGASSLRIVSDPNAEGFYLRMGARRVGSVPSKPAGRELPELVLDLAV